MKLRGGVYQKGPSWIGRWNNRVNGRVVQRTARVCQFDGVPRIEAMQILQTVIEKERIALASNLIGEADLPCAIPAMNGRRSARAGVVAEMAVVCDLLAKEHDVFRAVNADAAFDLVAFKDGKITRIEVKKGAVTENGRLVCNIKNRGKFDVLAVVDGSKIQYIPEPCLSNNRRRMRVRTPSQITGVCDV